jgi:hypothetical protein
LKSAADAYVHNLEVDEEKNCCDGWVRPQYPTSPNGSDHYRTEKVTGGEEEQDYPRGVNRQVFEEGMLVMPQ